jgi:hypothetical protein
MSFSLIVTGRLINEGLLSYTKGTASSGSGFKVAILLAVEQLANSRINSNMEQIKINFDIYCRFVFCKSTKTNIIPNIL